MGQTVREDLTMGKMNMTPKEFLEKMYGVELKEPTPEELEKVGQWLEQGAQKTGDRKDRRRGQESI